MNQALPRGMGALFAGGMEACWMVGGLWLLEARAAPEALPVPWLMLGLPLAFTLWRLTRALSPSLRFSAGLAGAADLGAAADRVFRFPGRRPAGARLGCRSRRPSFPETRCAEPDPTHRSGRCRHLDRRTPARGHTGRVRSPPERVSVRPADPALHFLLRRAVGCCAPGPGDGGVLLFHAFSAGDGRGPGRRCRRLAAGQSAGTLARRSRLQRRPGPGRWGCC